MEREASEAAGQVGSSFDVDRIVLLINPKSSGYNSLRPYIDELKSSDYGSRVVEVETEVEDSITEAKIQENVIENSRWVLVPAGGDATAHLAGQTIMKHYPNMDVGILVLPGGGASDVSYSIHGPGKLTAPSQILDNSRVKSVRPLEIKTSLGNRVREEFALVEAGIGMSGDGAEKINSAWFRNLPFHNNPLVLNIYDSIVAGESLLRPRPFQVEIDGHFEYVTEIQIANGSRVAKHFLTPIELEDEGFYVAIIEADRHLQKVASMIGNVLFMSKSYIDGNRFNKFRVGICDYYVRIQVDGEHRMLDPDTQVDVKQSDKILSFLTQNHHN